MAYAGRKRPARLSLPTRGAWIEIFLPISYCATVLSLPTRGAWIEICLQFAGNSNLFVAPHTGSVDKNIFSLYTIFFRILL